MFKKNSLFFILILLSLLILSGLFIFIYHSKSNNTLNNFIGNDPKITSNFWKISKTGEPTSYIVGSLHFGKPDDVIPTKIEQIIEQSDYVYTEVKFPDDLKTPKDPDYIEFMQKIYDKESGKTLADKIGQERFDLVKRMFTEMIKKKKVTQLNMDQFQYLQPWILTIYLPQILVEKNFSTEKGIDYLVIKKAKELKKPLDGLENHMFRYYILKEKPMNLILNDIDQVIYQQKLSELAMHSMYKLYHSGDGFEQIGMVLNPEKSMFSFLQSKEAIASAHWLKTELLNKRNLHWIPKILSALPKQKNLFVIGLLHLYGPTGIIQQLKKNGYTLTPL